MSKTVTKRKKVVKRLSPQEKAIRKEQRDQRNEITNILKNIGFSRLPYIDGKEFQYNGRTTEMDDIFIYKNIILITEYTIGSPGDHLLKKNYFYEKVLQNPKEFLEFMLTEEKLASFKRYYHEHLDSSPFSINHLIVCILYCSKKSISEEHKSLVQNVNFFDYNIVQYFKSLTKVIKKSSKYEFFDFLDISFDKVGENILSSSKNKKETFSGHILPEEKSKFNPGYKIVSFYIDAESLLKRAFVLRQEGWRHFENIGYYQRMIDSKKVSAMRKYLTDKNRVFINNIIATISVSDVKLLDEKSNEFIINKDGQFTSANQTTEVTPTQIEINEKCNIIGLIDGQHRTYAYHEGDDSYENKISILRSFQNLLVTAILFPDSETKENRLKFEANLFLEINSNQTNVRSQLKQEIISMITPFSTIAISKKVLIKLNESGPLSNLIERHSFEKGKIKTASIVSFGLNSLLKLDSKKNDSIFKIWPNINKELLVQKETDEYTLLNEYIDFCSETIRDIMIGFRTNIPKEKWCSFSPGTPKGILNVTFINGVLNVLRLLINNNKITTKEVYSTKLKNIDEFNFKSYKSSQYRKMGVEIYNKYFQ